MSILVGIPYATTDSKYWLDRTMLSIKEKLDADIAVAVDEGVSMLTGPIRFYQLWTVGHGVGKARNVLGLFALRQGYDCLIYMDSHVLVLSDNLEKICKSDLGNPKIVVVESRHFPSFLRWAEPFFYSVTSPQVNYNAFTLSSFLEKQKWKWAYIYELPSRKTVMTTEPVFSVSRRVLEALVQAQEVPTLAYYWGKENFDLTVSAARLGYDMTVYPEVVVGHVYKVGSPSSWSDRFKVTECRNEPFCGLLSGSVYGNGIKWADCVYAIKHYGSYWGLPVDYHVCDLVVKHDVDSIRRSIQFNAYAKYTLDQVYERLNTYLIGAKYVFLTSSPP